MTIGQNRLTTWAARPPLPAWACVMAILLGLLCSSLSAQGVLVNSDPAHPRRLPRPHWPHHPPQIVPPETQSEYRIESLRGDVRWADGVARVQVSQTFENTGSQTIEAVFVFPLPPDGVIDDLTFLVDGKEMSGKILSAEEARKIYQSYVRRNRDPALLEWTGWGMFQTNVFPIPAKAKRTVTIGYSQVTPSRFGLTEWTFPMQAAKYTSQPVEKTELRVHLKGDAPLKNIYSPTHSVSIERASDTTATVTYTSTDSVPDSDFRLFFDASAEPLSAKLLSYWPEDDDQGYFMMLATPPQLNSSDADRKPIPKTIVLVLDTSGSMSGDKIEQARDALQYVLNNLNEGDLFNIVTYNSSVELFKPELQRFNDESRSEASGFIAGVFAGGSTNISGALDSAFGMLQDDERPSYVVFLTDGLPTAGETNIAKIVSDSKKWNRADARLFSFGVGYDVNSRLLDTLSRDHSGLVEYVRPNESIEQYVSNLYRGIAAPVLTGVELDFVMSGRSRSDGKTVLRTYPDPLPDMFAGQQFLVVGRYRKSGAAQVKIEGRVRGERREYQIPVEFSAESSRSEMAFVAKLWAARRIGEILDLLDLKGDNQELTDELVRLAKKHGIVTPYTSFLAEEPNVLANQVQLQRLAQDRVLYFSEQSAGRVATEARRLKQQLRSSDSPARVAEAASSAQDALGLGGLPLAGPTRGGAIGAPAVAAGGARSAGFSVTAPATPVAAPAEPAVLTVGTKTFYRVDQRWVEEGISQEQLNQATNVERFSDRYFELLDRYGDDVGSYLSIDEPVVLRFGDEVFAF